MKVLVTGASGLIGIAICKKLLKEGFTVTGIVYRNKSEIVHKNYSQIRIDLANEQLSIENDFNAVIHCAAIIPSNHFNESELLLVNQKIDLNIISFCSSQKSKVIYFSTAFLYASLINTLNENCPLSNDIKGYYLSKKKTEDILTQSEIGNLVFRISSPYGDLNKQQNVLRIFANKIKKGLPVTLVGKGERKQNFIHTEDIAEACYKVIIKNSKGIFNLTYKDNYSMNQLADFIKNIYNSNSELLFDTTKKDTQPSVNFDNSKLKTELNWEPALDLKSGLLKTLLN